MKPTRAISIGLLLLGAALLLVPLNLLESPRPAPHSVSFITALRIIIGLPVVLFVPSFFFTHLLFRADLRLPGKPLDEVDPGWFALSAAGLGLLFHFLNFNLLRSVGLTIDWATLTPLILIEGGIGFTLLRRQTPNLHFSRPQASLRKALITALVGASLFAVWQRAHLTQDSSWYFDDDSLNHEIQPSHHPGAIRYAQNKGQAFVQASPFSPEQQVETIVVSNDAEGPQLVPLYFLVHSRVGASAQLVVHHNSTETPGISPPSSIGSIGTIEQASRWGDHLVERYWEWGTVLVSEVVRVPAKGSAAVDLRLIPSPGSDASAALDDFQIIALANLTGPEVRGELQELGIHSMHAFQMLNVTENVRWAAEVASTHVLPGHSPPWAQPPSTLHQPPAWTYLYAPARELLTPQLISASALLVLILLAIVLGALKGMEAAPGMQDWRVATLLTAVLSLGGAQHGRLMVSDGSMNFPDNLFACALVLAVVSLVTGRSHIFVLWAMLAALLRYPGAVVVLLAGLSLLAVDKQRRVHVIDGLMRFGLAIALFCGVMLVVGVVSGILPTWLYALYFETIPEHFHNPPGDAPDLLQRPLHFVRIWMLVGGGILLLAFPFRGHLAKVSALTAVLYFPFLAFIHHHSHHYFLPLVALAGLSACSSIANDPKPTRRLVLAWCALVVAAGLFWYAKMKSL